MDNLTVIVISTIASVFLGYWTSQLANLKNKPILFVFFTLLFISLIGIGFYVGCFYLHSKLKIERQLEGYWIETYSDDKGEIVYAIATFKYNAFKDNLEFSGTGFNKYGAVVGTWDVTKARLANRDYIYLFDGDSKNPNEEKQGPRKGMGSISFDPNYIGGTGWFIAAGSPDEKRRSFNLYKVINGDTIKELQNNNSKNIIQNLYKDPSSLTRITSGQ